MLMYYYYVTFEEYIAYLANVAYDSVLVFIPLEYHVLLFPLGEFSFLYALFLNMFLSGLV